MATPKLQVTREERAMNIRLEDILPALPDGRHVIITKHGFHLTSLEYCDCGDRRYAKNVCFHMCRLEGYYGRPAKVLKDS